ncbi:hypothetical protein CLOP_g14283, partial [Closterium sp. NIES-67]
LEDASSSSSSSSSGVRVSGTRRVLLVAYTTGFHNHPREPPARRASRAVRRVSPAAVPPPSGVAFESRRLSGQFPYLDDDEPYADVADGVDEPYACEDERVASRAWCGCTRCGAARVGEAAGGGDSCPGGPGGADDGYADASPRAGAHAAGLPSVPPVDPTHAGNVVVRDVATRAIIAHFRAHGSAIALLAFDCSGTLLLSASLCGHSLNVFRLTPAPTPANAPAAPALVDSKPQDGCSYVHLYRLHRGLTNAVIQSAAISHDSRWVAVSSARGTTHLFAISPFGGPVGPATHLPSPSSPTLLHPVYTHSPSLLPPPPPRPWWSSYAPLRFSSSPSHAPPPLRVPAPVALSSVARIRNANSGWRGNVTGVAAAAAGLGMEIPGAVAAAFHFGGVPGGGVLGGRGEAGHQQQQQQQQHQQVLAGQFYGQPEWAPPPIAEQLWVFSPLGHLIRYHLTPYAAASDPSSSSSSSPSHSHGRAMHPPNSYSQAYSSHTYDPRGSYLPPHGATSAGAMQPGRGAIPPFSPIPPFPPMAQSDSSVLGGRSFERLPSLPTLALRSAAAAAGVSVRGMGGGGTRAGGEVVLQVAAEASEVWDVCRRVSWSDRDEPIQGAWDAHSTAAAAASLDAAAGSSGRCSAEEGRQRAVEEAEQRAYLMHAEVQLTTSRATPLWARTYIRLQPEDSPSSSSHTASQSPTQGRTTHPPLPSHTPQGTPAVTGMGSSPPFTLGTPYLPPLPLPICLCARVLPALP